MIHRFLTPGRALAFASVVALMVWAARVDIPRLTGGIKGDEATYVSEALSLANDGDLKYGAEDFRRFVKIYGTSAVPGHDGPEGIFLKRSYRLEWHVHLHWPFIKATKIPVPWEQGLGYGKPFAYAALGAPFVKVIGVGGLLALNVLLLALSFWCAVAFCRARAGRVAGTLIGAAFIGASVAPLYSVWLTPEIFNFTLVTVAYFLWLYKEVAPDAPRWLRRPALDWVAALLLGVATFSKVSNGLLIGPLLVAALVRRQWSHLALVAALFVAGSAGLFGLTGLTDGEWNFQGGDRNYFVSHFPFDRDGTTFTAGSAMSTNEATDENILSPHVLFPMLRYNVAYFLFGRDAGLVPYYFPGVLVFVLWLWRWRQSTLWQWATCLACVGSALGLMIFAPSTWNGGGGPVGNRYFLAIYPTLLFLVPAGISVLPGLVAAVVGLTFIGPILVRPFSASHDVWLNPDRWPLRLLPIELTIMEQLPVKLNSDRSHVEVSKDPEVLLYYMDRNTYYQERDGFWVAPGTTEIVIRTDRPLSLLTLWLTSRTDNVVDVSIGGRSTQQTLRPNEETMVRLAPAPGVYTFWANYQIVLRITTATGFHPQDLDPASTDTRYLGVFVKPKYDVK